MRLLCCLECADILTVRSEEATTCFCGKSRAFQVNPADVAYQGPAGILTIKPGDVTHLLEDPEWPCKIHRLPTDHPFIYRTTSKDCGVAWGKARSRARRGMANNGGNTAVFSSVRMEWDTATKKTK